MAAMAAHRGGRRRPFKSVTLPLRVFHFLVQPPPDWADGLPLDIMLCIFHRLGHVQIMMGADKGAIAKEPDPHLACPSLKHLRYHHPYWDDDTEPEFFDMEAMEIAKMHELRSLQLFHNQLTNIGLSAILDGCPHLESLDVRGCYCVDLHDEAMRAKCARIKTKKIFTPNPEDECEDFEPASPISNKWHPRKYPKPWTCLDRDDYADYYDPCYGLDSLDEIGLEVHDRMLCKRARRYQIMRWTGIM
ncbi:hypothetical protein HU200_047404 [Digitaria exilis]|uniref:Uncharacterized protein n=1 Tax=Digitaria exilis TaxID=1010633 RepID=A0A835EDY4_9POAL|nr:hypothetical protein HU200_047404 [Digitaria exilis]